MLSVEEALDAVLSRVRALPSVSTPLADVLGRVLAEEITADIANPPFDNSAVDGYAVRAADTAGASRARSVWLNDLGEVMAGRTATVEVAAGCCMRVMTGAPMPPGADAMVMREDARQSGEQVEIYEPAAAGDHVRRAGEDFHQGDVVLRAGSILHAAEVAMLAAVGRPEVSVYRRPRVAVFSTGDELVDLDILPGPGQIRDSNRYTLEALVRESGAEVALSQRLPDDLDLTIHAFSRAAGLASEEAVDVIVTSGGVSVGDRDFVKPALEHLGTLDLWRVRMKPGKPLAFGTIGETLFLGLPGNPVSTMVTFELFVRPVLWKLAGNADLERPQVEVELADAIRHTPGRREYARAAVWLEGSRLYAWPTGAQGSGVLTSMLGANALLVIPEDSAGYRPGDRATALMLAAPFSGPPA